VAGLDAEQAKHILGAQANFWSHIAREPALVDRQIFPRLLALAERDWSPVTTTNWPAFSERLEAQLPRLGQMGIRYHGMPPDIMPAQDTFK
jgi:hexosaminidase